MYECKIPCERKVDKLVKKIFVIAIALIMSLYLFISPILALGNTELMDSKLPPNTAQAVYGEKVILINVNGNYDYTFSISLTDIKPQLESDPTTRAHINELMGNDLSKVLHLYRVDFGQNDDEFNRLDLPKGGMLSIEIEDKTKVQSIGAVYKNKVKQLKTDEYSFSKDGKRAIITLDFDTNFDYVAMVDDLSIPKGSSSSGLGINLGLGNIDTTTLITIIEVFGILVGGVVLAIIFVKKMKKKKAQDWLRRK